MREGSCKGGKGNTLWPLWPSHYRVRLDQRRKKRGRKSGEGDRRRRSHKTRTALAPSLQTFIFREWICMMRARARSFG